MDSLSPRLQGGESLSRGEPDKKPELPPRCCSGRWARDAAVMHPLASALAFEKSAVLVEDGLVLFERRAVGGGGGGAGTDALIFQQGFSCGVS